MVDPELEGEVLVELNETIRASLMEEMEDAELLAVAEGMELDDLAHLVADLPGDRHPAAAAIAGCAGSRAPQHGA